MDHPTYGPVLQVLSFCPIGGPANLVLRGGAWGLRLVKAGKIAATMSKAKSASKSV